jgi:DNA-binding NarL/FixJ family response regulator
VGSFYDALAVSARVLLVEPNRLLRRGIRAELSGKGAEVVAEAATAEEAIAATTEHEPDVVVLNVKLPDRPAAEVCGVIAARFPRTVIVVLADHDDQQAVNAAIEAGARAYLLTDADDLDLAAAVKRALAGERVIDPRAAAALLDAKSRSDEPQLTSQELKVLRLVAEGLTNPEIGSRLYLSRHTVKEYLSHAMRKLDAANRIDAVRKATARGLIAGVSGPSREHAGETLVYNESGSPARSSDLKVPPVKLDRLREAPKRP